MSEHYTVAINYGVNIFKTDDIAWSRYTTVNTLSEAIDIYNALVKKNEAELWNNVEIEQINTLNNGDFNYSLIKRQFPWEKPQIKTLSYKEKLKKVKELNIEPSTVLIANEMEFQLNNFYDEDLDTYTSLEVSESVFNQLCSVAEECYLDWDECDVSHICFVIAKLYATDKINPKDITKNLVSDNY